MRIVHDTRVGSIYPGNFNSFTGIVIDLYGHKDYYENGHLHRIDGAAWHTFNNKLFYLRGINYTKEEWFELLDEDEKLEALYNIDNWNSDVVGEDGFAGLLINSE